MKFNDLLKRKAVLCAAKRKGHITYHEFKAEIEILQSLLESARCIHGINPNYCAVCNPSGTHADKRIGKTVSGPGGRGSMSCGNWRN